MNTGLFDKNGTPINIGNKTRLVLDDGEVTFFLFSYSPTNHFNTSTCEQLFRSPSLYYFHF